MWFKFVICWVIFQNNVNWKLFGRLNFFLLVWHLSIFCIEMRTVSANGLDICIRPLKLYQKSEIEYCLFQKFIFCCACSERLCYCLLQLSCLETTRPKSSGNQIADRRIVLWLLKIQWGFAAALKNLGSHHRRRNALHNVATQIKAISNLSVADNNKKWLCTLLIEYSSVLVFCFWWGWQ